MIVIKDKKDCSGCHGCYSICPTKAIEMKTDHEGFWFPEVDYDKCIKCGMCIKVCPIINNKTIENDPKAYAMINKDDKVRLDSSSGGIFTLLAEYIIENKGVVFGAAFNNDMEVNHIKVSKKEDLAKLRGSKYVQSKIGETYKECLEELKKDKLVLFTGTPCQIEGLLGYLQKDYKNLYTQDNVCHGVPSPKVWKIYLDKVGKHHNGKPIKVNFRKKTTGWLTYSLCIDYANSKNEVKRADDTYFKAFLSDISLRDSCFDCKAKKYNRLSDITLADYWGVQNLEPEMHDGKGTSLVIINSKKGNELFNKIKNKTKNKETNMDEAIKKYNPVFIKSVPKPKNRDKFLKDVNIDNFDELVIKYSKKTIVVRMTDKLKRVVKRVIGRN